MTQFTTMVLKDHAGADHSFVPRDISNGVATAVNSTGVPIGERTASLSVSRTSTGRRKVTMKMVLPIVQDAVNGGVSKPTVVRTSYVDVVFTFDGTSSTAEREDALAYAINLLKETGIVDPAVTDLSAPY